MGRLLSEKIPMTNSVSWVSSRYEYLPGIGNKTAERLAYFVLESDVSFSDEFSESLSDIRYV